jgi:hypothetical protein
LENSKINFFRYLVHVFAFDEMLIVKKKKEKIRMYVCGLSETKTHFKTHVKTVPRNTEQYISDFFLPRQLDYWTPTYLLKGAASIKTFIF